MTSIEMVIGKKVQRKGSKIIWQMIEARCPASGSPVADNEVHMETVENFKTYQVNWISVDNINKNWKEVAA